MSRAVGISLEKLRFIARLPRATAIAPLRSEFYRTAHKAARVSSKIVTHLTKSSVKTLFARGDAQLRQAILDTHQVCREGLETLNFEVEVVGHDPELMREKTFLIVGNHMSYMDVLVFAAAQPAVFVTSVDMGQVPLLGHLARSGGSLFVERRHRERMDNDRGTLTETLKRGFHVLIYPEGTSTNGLEVKPFKKGLLTAAQAAGVDILPVVTSYVSIDGQPFDASTCDRIAWHGDMKFAPHLLQLLRLRKVKVRLEFLAPIKITPDISRDEIALRSREAIVSNYKPTPSSQT